MSARLISTQRHTHLQPEYILKQEKTRVGRHPDNDVVVMLESISRFHAEFEQQDGIVVLRDLGSRNGTFMNGHTVKNAVPVRSGDRIQFGNVEFVFRSGDLSEPTAKSVTETNVVVGGRRKQSMEVVSSKGFDTMVEELSQARSTEAGSELIMELYQAALWLRDSRSDPSELCVDLLHRIFKLVPASRGAVLMRPNSSSDLEPIAWLRRKESKKLSSPSIVIPSAIMDEVEQNCRAVLMGDAATDERFKHSDSIAEAAISSAICVPLVIDKALTGLIYLDNQGEDSKQFSETHLAFVGSVAQELAFSLQMRGDGKVGSSVPDLGALLRNMARASDRYLKSDQDMGGKLSLALDDGDLEEARRLWRSMRRGLRSLEGLVGDMYEFGRAYRAKRQTVHINEVILDTLDTFSEEVRARRLDIRKTLARELHAYQLDEEAFYKAILALMLNAVENAPEGGVIEVVTFEGNDGKLHVEIIDNGKGIPEDVAKRMFQPFNAGEKSPGTGMGLANTKRLVEAMGGAVHVTSGKGGGTQATLIFPAALQASAAEAS